MTRKKIIVHRHSSTACAEDRRTHRHGTSSLRSTGRLCIEISILSPAYGGGLLGNDLSSRYWQFDPSLNGNQHGNAKSFDKFASIGPVIVSKAAIGNPESLQIRTWINGDLRQDGNSEDLVHKLSDIVRFLTVGKTLRKGTIILTGTPSGVAAGFNPPPWLQDRDLVEIEIEKIGKIANKMALY